jgi:hypothetical protein
MRRAYILAFLLSIGTALHAQVPRTLTYQVVLTDTAGTPVPNGTYSHIFRPYQTSTGGSPLWQETKNRIRLDSSGSRTGAQGLRC